MRGREGRGGRAAERAAWAARGARAGLVLLLALALVHHGPVLAVFLAGAVATMAWAARCERAAGRPL